MRLHLVSLKVDTPAQPEGAASVENKPSSWARGTGAADSTAASNDVTRQVHSPRARGRDAWPSEGELVPGVARHARYLSDFQDDMVRLDVSHHQARGTHIITIDIQSQLVSCNGGRSHYREPRPLTYFTEAVDAFKIALNRTLARHHKGLLSTAVLECKRSFLRIFAWMSRNCIYRLDDLNRELIESLVSDVSQHGWDGVLDQTELLRGVIARAKTDIDIFCRIYDRYRNAKAYTLPISELEAIVGMPLYEWTIPRSLYEEFAALEGDSRPISKVDVPRRLGATRYAIRDTMVGLNALALSTPGSIPFLPFANIHDASLKAFKAAQAILKAEQVAASGSSTKRRMEPQTPPQLDGNVAVEGKRGKNATQKSTREPSARAHESPSRQVQEVPPPQIHVERQQEHQAHGRKPTVNLSVNECVSIFAEALRWTYDYSPAILQTIEFARSRISELGGKDSYALSKAWKDVYAFYEVEAAKVNLPIKSIAQRNQGALSLRSVVKLCQFALFTNFGINSARRPNELIGRRKVPYGLYLGAVSRVQDEPAIYRVDSYVSKGPMSWLSFPANRLMADAYFVLERLYELHEPYGAPERDETTPPEVARQRKLFTLRDITPMALSPGSQREHFHAKERGTFLSLAGVNPKRFDGSITPFRRMFSVLNMRRYDLPEHPALQTYLGHLDAATTGGYYNDREVRAPGESLLELHAPDYVDTDLLKDLETADLEYLAEKLLRMLQGEQIAGGFPVVAAKLAKQMSSTASFAVLTNELKAGVLAKRLHDDGHRCMPMPHVCCMSGHSAETTEKAKCYRDGSLHHEESSPLKCSGCVNQMASESYLKSIEVLAAEAEMTAVDAGRPAAVRHLPRRPKRSAARPRFVGPSQTPADSQIVV